MQSWADFVTGDAEPKVVPIIRQTEAVVTPLTEGRICGRRNIVSQEF